MSVRIRIGLISFLIVALAAGAFAWAQRDRIDFVGKCWNNGNALGECHCTFNALAELPDNYRKLAVSWAHDSGTAYALGVMRLIGAETWRIGANRFRPPADLADKDKVFRRGIRMLTEKLGWFALQQVAPVAVSVLGPVVAAAPLMTDAVNQLAAAQGVLGRHCGTGETFIVRLNRRLQALAQALD